MPLRRREPGEFCWINIVTPHPAEAQAFFAALLGWTYQPIPGMGHRCQVGGRDVGGIFDLAGPQTPPGTMPGIGVMVRVEDVDATAARAATLGGRAGAAFDIGPSGRMAECWDPTNANFDLWQPRQDQGTDADESLVGAPSWFELMTSDVDRARAFYEALFGWTAEAMPGQSMPYTTFKLGDRYVAGMMAITPEMHGVPPCWMPYFTVSDADAAAREAVRLGGSVYLGVKEAASVGRFCGIRSPQGVHFLVMQYVR
ncbi:MAG: VOC family protein [Gemmatimonadetes bacterium]|nr:VOC family protein [Gemmatimonadota bacterium]